MHLMHAGDASVACWRRISFMLGMHQFHAWDASVPCRECVSSMLWQSSVQLQCLSVSAALAAYGTR